VNVRAFPAASASGSLWSGLCQRVLQGCFLQLRLGRYEGRELVYVGRVIVLVTAGVMSNLILALSVLRSADAQVRLSLCPAYPGNPRNRIEGESPLQGKGHTVFIVLWRVKLQLRRI
jgi:hypothetical protein